MRELVTIFLTVFLAEIGDKTQLATVLFATDGDLSRWSVFAAAALALVVATAIAVIAGGAIGNLTFGQKITPAACQGQRRYRGFHR